MADDDGFLGKAYNSAAFMGSRDARPLRVLAEYVHPESRFESMRISDTIVFFGSARTLPRDKALSALNAAREHGGDVVQGRARPGDVALLRGVPGALPAPDRMVQGPGGKEPALRGLLRRRAGHHGGRQPRRLGGHGDQHRAGHLACPSSSTATSGSPASSASSSTTSSCASSGSSTWPRRWSPFPAASAPSTSSSRC